MVPVAAKVGALLAVAAAGSTSIWYFSDSIFGTSLVSIADENPATTYNNKSIGKNYSKYFLSSKNNKKTWEERYKEHKGRFSDPGTNKVKDKFSTVDSAFSTEAETEKTKSLNKICEAAYKETTSTNLVDAEPTENNTTQFFKTNVWEFCGLGKIVTLDKDTKNYPSTTFTSSKIGGDTTNNKLFVSTKVDSNDWFWNLKTKEFWADPKKIEGKDKNENEFKKLSDDQNSKKDEKSIKETCQAIYEKDSSGDNDNKNKEDAEKFCSIKLTLLST